jgi:hypothetical protein
MRITKPSLFGKLLLLALLAVCVSQASATVTYYVGSCQTGGYPSIGAALAANPAPNVVKVCPGTYPEQVVITYPVTLQGILANGMDQAFITVPSGGLQTDAWDGSLAAQVWVNNVTGPVNISSITVDGDGNGLPNGTPVAGVFYENSSGTVKNVEARYQKGTGFGVGIWAEVYNSTNQTVTIENCNVHNFDSTGIDAEGDSNTGTLAANVEDNSVVGTNYTPPQGLVFVGNVSVTASGNVVTGEANELLEAISMKPSGITGVGAGPTGSVTKNTIAGAELGIWVVVGDVSVTSNKIYNVDGPGVLIGDGGTHPTPVVEGNTITQAEDGIDFQCVVDNNVSGNTISVIHSDGLANVPSSVTSNNTYINVPTIRSGGC